MAWNPIRRIRARRWNLDRGWKYVGRTAKDVALEDWPVDLWSQRWVRVGNQVLLQHPGNAQAIMVDCFFIIDKDKRHPFAALEMSDATFIFFVPV